MFDARLRPWIDPLLDRLAGLCVAGGLSADRLTGAGFAFGLVCAVCVAWGLFLPALLFLGLNRLCDGLDGAVARRTKTTDFGGYLDIVCDFIFYAALPFAFIVYQPANALAGAFLIFSFVGTGTSFLAYAILQAKTGMKEQPEAQKKSFFYLGGLTEGTETIALFVFVILLPHFFIPAAVLFGVLCWLTTFSRVAAARRDFYF